MKKLLITLLALGTVSGTTSAHAQSTADISFIKPGTYKTIDIDGSVFSGSAGYTKTSCDRHVEVDVINARIYMSTVDKGNGKCRMQESIAYNCSTKDGLTTCEANHSSHISYSSRDFNWGYNSLEKLTLIPDGAIYIEDHGQYFSYTLPKASDYFSMSYNSYTKFVKEKEE